MSRWCTRTGRRRWVRSGGVTTAGRRRARARRCSTRGAVIPFISPRDHHRAANPECGAVCPVQRPRSECDGSGRGRSRWEPAMAKDKEEDEEEKKRKLKEEEA